MKSMKIAVLGTQASGKGTQSLILSESMKVPAVSVGDLLRDLQNEDSERGRSAKAQMSKGSFVPDSVILPLVREWVERHPQGWIIDGFPRSLEQAKQSTGFFHPDAALYLEVPDEESKKRISHRRVCAACRTNYNLITQPPKNPRGVCDACGGELARRADDTPDLVEQRLKNYHQVTEPLKKWFDARKKLVLIDAREGIKEVADDVRVKLADLRRRSAPARWFKVSGLLFVSACLVTALVALARHAFSP